MALTRQIIIVKPLITALAKVDNMDGTETQQIQQTQANNLFTLQSEEPNEQIMRILLEKDDISWQQIIYELVRSEQMDPWDIDISLLTKRYIEMIQKLKELNFRVSGKIVLAAAILLRIKSTKLVGEDMLELDKLIEQTETMEPDLLDDISPERIKDLLNGEKPTLIPKLPQPRKRKVSIHDLVRALEKALEVKERRLMNSMPKSIIVPKKPVDITIIIKELYIKIKRFFSAGLAKLTFDKLIPSKNKEDVVYTFVPLLHLATQRKIDMLQEVPFGEIEIKLLQAQQPTITPNNSK